MYRYALKAIYINLSDSVLGHVKMQISSINSGV